MEEQTFLSLAKYLSNIITLLISTKSDMEHSALIFLNTNWTWKSSSSSFELLFTDLEWIQICLE